MEQPPPIRDNNGRPIWELVLEDMKERHSIGIKRYGTPLQANNGRNALRDAYEECLDMAVYLRQKIEEDTQRPRIVCLVGSTRFKETFINENARLTGEGHIVLSVGFFGHSDKLELTPEMKKNLDLLHLKKVEMAHRIHVINVDGYIGNSTRNELNHAFKLRKVITFLEPHKSHLWNIS